MSNQYTIIIDGNKVREARCKNDECRTLLGYENIKYGILIFTCPSCGYISTFKRGYNQKKEFIDQLKDRFPSTIQKGGE